MRTLVLIAAFTVSAVGQTATDNPQLASAKAAYDSVKSLILRSADKMPEDKYAFKPAPEVMSYGQCWRILLTRSLSVQHGYG
jgi:hypothetical protein